MKRIAIPLVFGLVLAGPVLAQSAPFDMSGERAAEKTLDPKVELPSPGTDDMLTTPIAVKKAEAAFRRPLLPFGKLELEGERDERTWSVYLTPGQANATAILSLGYQNAVVVAPETSRLEVDINGVVIGGEPVGSPDGVKQLSFPVPPSLLRAGSNLVTLRASQRHRTDCSVESTYELWSAIDPQTTYLEFGSAAAGRLTQIDDIRAIGLDAAGMTQFRFVVPALEQPVATGSLLKLAQGMALIANMPSQSFFFERSFGAPSRAGQLAVIVGTPAELLPILPQLPASAAAGPIATFVDMPGAQGQALVISGPTWSSIDGAIESIVAPLSRAEGMRREVLLTERWRSPDAPLLAEERYLTFRQLGVGTREFSGRRLRTSFAIGVPGDFYADAYGEAQILLDAAYTDAVLPGSHIDVYVNGNIAATAPITAPGGGLFRHLPIRVTMRHFEPGLNTITVEAVLRTEEDGRCVPGSTASERQRFALFDTSEFHMPNFARIGQVPNLSATFGVGFPYGVTPGATSLFMDRLEPGTLSAAATFMGQLAQAAGTPVDVDVVSSLLKAGNGNAIFIGAISQIPETVVRAMNVDSETMTGWGAGAGDGQVGPTTQETYDEWRDRLHGASWSGRLTGVSDWLKRNFDISAKSLRFRPREEKDFRPPDTATLLVAQASSPSSDGTWTLVSAPTGQDLWDGVLAISTGARRSEILGNFAVYNSARKTIETTPVSSVRFIDTQPASLANYRLIAANWLSTNILSYALALIALSILLGLSTAGLLTNLGRSK